MHRFIRTLLLFFTVATLLHTVADTACAGTSWLDGSTEWVQAKLTDLDELFGATVNLMSVFPVERQVAHLDRTIVFEPFAGFVAEGF